MRTVGLIGFGTIGTKIVRGWAHQLRDEVIREHMLVKPTDEPGRIVNHSGQLTYPMAFFGIGD